MNAKEVFDYLSKKVSAEGNKIINMCRYTNSNSYSISVVSADSEPVTRNGRSFYPCVYDIRRYDVETDALTQLSTLPDDAEERSKYLEVVYSEVDGINNF